MMNPMMMMMAQQERMMTQMNQMAMMQMSMKGKGKGMKGMKGMMPMEMMAGPYGHKGGGRGIRASDEYQQSPLKSCPKEQVVYISGLGDDHQHDPAFDKDLQAFLNDAIGGCSYVETGVKSGGQGAAIFDTEELVQNAINLLNGTSFRG